LNNNKVRPLAGVRIPKSDGTARRRYTAELKAFNLKVEMEKMPKAKNGKPYKSKARMEYFMNMRRINASL
jgi:hypothetical protein